MPSPRDSQRSAFHRSPAINVVPCGPGGVRDASIQFFAESDRAEVQLDLSARRLPDGTPLLALGFNTDEPVRLVVNGVTIGPTTLTTDSRQAQKQEADVTDRDLLRLLVKHRLIRRDRHLSSLCPVVTDHPGWSPVCNCGLTTLLAHLDSAAADESEPT